MTQITAVTRSFYLFCFLTGVVGTPLYFIFTVTLQGRNEFDPSHGYWSICILLLMYAIPLWRIAVRGQREVDAWPMSMIGFLLLGLGYWGVGAIIVRTVWHWYMDAAHGRVDNPGAWFGPLLLIATLPFAAWAAARLHASITEIKECK